MVQVAYQNRAGSLESTHAFLEWCREKESGIVFVGKAWIEKNRRGTQPSFVLVTTAKKGRRVMAYIRKGLEEEIEVVEEEDNQIML